ncbi:hypothetical protein EXU57_02060 [Segetibacter sp. 3557_3]|uniref:hypothetical protein n=1 Tax=Segetibacter sp. 3557_3 TaxID=2547429 RepID=UPI001058FDF8|nr:hypothetical protein [Segetibacter sp. 3557_3]TDH28879.1 hypothetical protein EXU57_02060 [Segetibacter sp. 3557_3]
MKSTLFIAALFAVFAVCAQDREFPDYRSKNDIFTRIREKEIRDDVATFSMGGIEEIIGKLPLKSLPVTGYGADYISFGGNGMEVLIKAERFDPTKHKLSYYENKHLVRIDNKAYFGDYGKVPRTAIQSVSVITGRDTIRVPQAAFADIFNPIFTYSEGGVNKSHNSVYLSADGRRIYVYMLKPESGGSYEVTWVIQDKKYVRRVVDFGFLR